MSKLIEWLISMVAVVAIYLLMIGLFVAFWSPLQTFAVRRSSPRRPHLHSHECSGRRRYA
jgi:hypothetical protein